MTLVLPIDRWPMPPTVKPFLLRIPRAPVPAARPRTVTRGKGGRLLEHARTYTPKEYDEWKHAAVQLLQFGYRAAPIEVPVHVAVEAVFPRPTSAPKHWSMGGKRYKYPWPWTEGRNPYIGLEDYDNLIKAALDACVQGGVLVDDRLCVQDAGSRKVFAAEGEAACVEVRFYPAW